MTASPDYASERRARLAAERLLQLKERKLGQEAQRLDSLSKVLSEEIRSKRHELDELRLEAERLRRENAQLRDTSARRAAEAAASERNLWMALQSMRDGFAIYDSDHRLVIANDAYLSVFEDLEEVSAGMPFRKVCELALAEGIVDPGPRGTDWAGHMAARWSKSPIPDATFRLWNGRIVKAIDRVVPGGGVVSLCIDQTEVLRLKAAIESIPDGFVLYDPDDRLIMVNDAFRRAFLAHQPDFGPGTSFAEMLQDGLARGIFADAVGREEAWFEERLEDHARGDGIPREQALEDGRWLRIIETRTPDGSIAGMRIDITDLKRAKEAAEAASRAKSAFLSNISHEIRTPVNGIVGLAEIMMDGELDPEQRDYLQALSDSAGALLALVDDVLDYSSSETAALELDPRPFDTAALLRDPVESFRAECRRRGLDLRLEADPALPARLVGDDRRLRQILTNLVANAVKFTERGGITIRARAEPEGSSLVRLAIEVEDTGIGVPEDRAALIFGGFARGDEEHNRRHEGTGLGLAICRRIVERMGGEIGHRAADGGGSVFAVSLALPRAEPAALEPDAPEPKGGGTGLRVVAAEDNATNRLILCKLLEPLGVDLHLVENGFEAVEAVTAAPPDLVLMDISMPGMDGKEATGRIRSWEAETGRAALPIVAMTAHALPGDIAEIRAAGLDDVITKPLSRRTLADRLAEVRAAGQAAAASALRRNAGAPAAESSGA